MLKEIKKLCKERGETLTEMELACGLAARATRRWDENAPSVHAVQKVADHFGVSVEEIIKGEEAS